MVTISAVIPIASVMITRRKVRIATRVTMAVETSAPSRAAVQYWVMILPASSKGMPNLFFTNMGAQVRKV